MTWIDRFFFVSTFDCIFYVACFWTRDIFQQQLSELLQKNVQCEKCGMFSKNHNTNRSLCSSLFWYLIVFDNLPLAFNIAVWKLQYLFVLARLVLPPLASLKAAITNIVQRDNSGTGYWIVNIGPYWRPCHRSLVEGWWWLSSFLPQVIAGYPLRQPFFRRRCIWPE